MLISSVNNFKTNNSLNFQRRENLETPVNTGTVETLKDTLTVGENSVNSSASHRVGSNIRRFGQALFLGTAIIFGAESCSMPVNFVTKIDVPQPPPPPPPPTLPTPPTPPVPPVPPLPPAPPQPPPVPPTPPPENPIPIASVEEAVEYTWGKLNPIIETSPANGNTNSASVTSTSTLKGFSYEDFGDRNDFVITGFDESTGVLKASHTSTTVSTNKVDLTENVTIKQTMQGFTLTHQNGAYEQFIPSTDSVKRTQVGKSGNIAQIAKLQKGVTQGEVLILDSLGKVLDTLKNLKLKK